MRSKDNILSGHSIQPMSSGDLDDILRIEKASFSKPWTRAMFEGELKNPVSFAYTLRVRPERKEELAAYIVFWIVHGEAHILNIAVAPALRGRGVASKLLALMLQLMKRNMVYEVFLEVRVSNEAARSLYKKFGFREAFVRKNYYGDEDAIVMVLDL
ncbi:MAG: ribosomal protein S18-alanine N-acetyltransferase [Candidatus Methylomirabilis sp.]|nr:ribosomal protein S18-alanine N-acetyltransferase [Deltaproteobacteria bacterium]